MATLPNRLSGELAISLRCQHRTERNVMTSEELVRKTYTTAEVKHIDARVGCFNPDGLPEHR